MTPTLPQRRGVSLYQSLKHDLLGHIRSGNYRVGDQVPTEPELCKLYGVSRSTVRQAVQELVLDGVLTRQQGRGTFVSALEGGHFSEPEPLRPILGKPPEFRYISSAFAPATADQCVALGIPPGAVVLSLLRVRLVDGVPTAVKRYAIPTALLGDSPPTQQEMETLLIGDILNRRGIRETRINISIRPAVIGAEDARLLEAPPTILVLEHLKASFGASGRVIRLTETIIRGDTARFLASAVPSIPGVD